MRPLPDVRVGDVWEDCDRRRFGRRVVVLWIQPPFPGGGVAVRGDRFAQVRGVYDGRVSSVKLRRFRRGSTGYFLVERAGQRVGGRS